jgi:DNA polymerase (family 10)
MTNQEIADVFHRLANLMELRQDDPFRIRSYRTAAETIEDWPKPLAEVAADGDGAALRELPGIGAAISQKILDLLATGSFKTYQEITAEIPDTVLDLLKVDGIGMKMLHTLYHQFQLTNLDDFARFVAGGGLHSVPGIGEKGQARIRESLRQLGVL